jgi:hypothetical protein
MMLNRTLLLSGVVAVIAVACGGGGFTGSDEDPGGAGDASAGEASGAQSSGGSSAAGMGAVGGSTEPGEAGASSEAGAASAGAPPMLPMIEIVQASRTSLVDNIDPSLTLSAVPEAGNALIVGITCFSEVENCVIPEGGVTDNQGNTYELVAEGSSIVSSSTHGSRPYLFIAENIGEPVGMVTITVNPLGEPITEQGGNYQNFAWGVLEVAGLAQNSVDKTGLFPNSCCDPSTTVMTDAATTQANELAVAVHSARSATTMFNYGNDPAWIEHHVNANGETAGSQHSLVTRILTEPGVVSHTWTHEVPTRGVSAIIATFRGVAP